MKNREEFEKLGKMWLEYENEIPETAVGVEVCDDCLYLWPAPSNDSKNTFFPVEKLADFVRFVNRHCVVSWDRTSEMIYARIF